MVGTTTSSSHEKHSNTADEDDWLKELRLEIDSGRAHVLTTASDPDNRESGRSYSRR